MYKRNSRQKDTGPTGGKTVKAEWRVREVCNVEDRSACDTFTAESVNLGLNSL